MNTVNVKIVLRRLFRNREYFFINLTGLTVSLASILLIGLYVADQFSFDGNIRDHERTYRVVEIQNQPGVGEQHVAVTMGPLSEALKNRVPHVEESVRMMYGWYINVIKAGEKEFRPSNLWYTDENMLDFFGYKLSEGSSKSALVDPRSVVLTPKTAMKFFGVERGVLGRTLELDGQTYKVTGLLEPFENKGHLEIGMLLSIKSITVLPFFDFMKQWGNNMLATYVRLDNQENLDKVESTINTLIDEQYKDQPKEFRVKMYLQNIRNIYLHSSSIKFQVASVYGNATLVYLFIAVALLVLITAIVNFINMSLARAVNRSREAGMRKVLGASRLNLFTQFFSESLFLSLFAGVLAIVITQLLLPALNLTLNTDISVSWLFSPITLSLLILLIMVVSLFGGLYPSLYLSRMQPIDVLKGGAGPKGKASGLLSRFLVGFQYSVTTALLIMVSVAWAQYHYATTVDLGINYSNVLAVNLPYGKAHKSMPAFQEAVSKIPGVEKVATSSGFTAGSGDQGSIMVDDSARTRITMRHCYVDPDFFEMMEIPVIMGRNFDRSILSDTNVVILNQAAVQALRWDNPLQQRFKNFQSNDSLIKMPVIGVVRDYHYYSLHWKIEPAVYVFKPKRLYTLMVKVNPAVASGEGNKRLLEEIGKAWNSNVGQLPIETTWVKQEVAKWYTSEQSMTRLFIFFALLSVLLSAFGLYGLSSLMMQQRVREIGVRRVLGASTYSLTLWLLQKHLRLVVVGSVIAVPLAWYFAQKLIEEFAYHIDLNFWVFLLAPVATLIIATSIILQRTIQTARTMPYVALKAE
ncbi:MAG: ABC transporter permease [Sphingobacteriia bacterium]|nr:ABC transporter permease [Sphingobacteriia bacterium]